MLQNALKYDVQNFTQKFGPTFEGFDVIASRIHARGQGGGGTGTTAPTIILAPYIFSL